MDFGKLTDKVKKAIGDRGGMDSLKEDAGELRDIVTGDGSLADKGKAAAEALREPGDGDAGDERAAAPEAPTPDVAPASPSA